MKRAMTAMTLVLAGLVATATAVNGVGVYIVQHAPECTAHMWGGSHHGGKMVRAVVKDNGVTADTIFNGHAQWPAINLAGTKVAFFRWGMTVENHGDQYLACVNEDAQCYLSLMNIDGSGLQNLIPVNPINTDANDKTCGVLDWPAGDWVYYEKPTKSGEIWRVNVTDPMHNEKVFAYPAGVNIRFWNMTIDGKYASLQSRSGTWNANGAHPFNDVSKLVGYDGCNAAISCGGGILAHYLYTPHSWTSIYRTDWKGYTRGTTVAPVQLGAGGVDLGHHNIDNLEQWLGEKITVPGKGGADLIQWSVNSEKWMIRYIGWCDQANGMEVGTNQIAVNWADRKAINLSRTKPPPCCTQFAVNWNDKAMCPVTNITKWYSDMPFTGDFWVDLGAGNHDKWEDEFGHLHGLDGSVSTADGATILRASYFGASTGKEAAFDLFGRKSAPGMRAAGIVILRSVNGGHVRASQRSPVDAP